MKKKHYFGYLLALLTLMFFLPACSEDAEKDFDNPSWGGSHSGSQTGSLSGSVISESKPKSGQKHRSSDNFSTKALSKSSYIMWGCPEGVTFSVHVDKTGTDEVFATGLSNGSFTEFRSSDKLYIADPSGASENFTVTYTCYNPGDGVVLISSEKGPMSGQKHRSSHNFQLGNEARYIIECDPDVKFDISHDVSAASDKTIYTDVKNGMIINTPTDNNLYISDPEGVSSTFIVKFTPYNPAWMTALSDNLHLSELSIPGTHDTGTGTDGVSAGMYKCQNYTIPSQLNFGIRYFDLRVKQSDLGIFHGNNDCEINLSDVLTYFNDFLKNNEKETILMQIKGEDGKASENLGEFFNEEKNKSLIANVYMDSKIPTLGQARGKIILFRRFDKPNNNYPWGINVHDQWPDDSIALFMTSDGDNIFIEDRFFDSSETIHDSKEKSNLVEMGINHAQMNKDVFHILFTSIAGRVTHTPWNYAWGESVLEIDPEMSKALYGHLSGIKTYPSSVGTILMDFYNKHGNDDPYHNVERIINFNYPKDSPYIDLNKIKVN